MDKDIGNILKSWEHQPGALIIRKIMGDDGKEKIQIRISMGLLQMETEGRPDGQTPHNSKSLLEYYNLLVEEFVERDGTANSFNLTKTDMKELDDELMQYYHRRICFFALGDHEYARVDAEHNLALMDIIKEYCEDEDYVESHEKYRPFVIMERARAVGLDSINKGDYASAMKCVGDAIHQIEEFHRERGVSDEVIRRSREVVILRKWRSQIHQDWEGGISEENNDGDSDSLSL